MRNTSSANVVDLEAIAPQSAVSGDQFKSLKSKALTGTLWNVGAYGGSMALRFLFNVVLSRLLAPQYFGLLTLLNTAITGLTFFSDIGLTPNIVRSARGDEPDFLNTAWTMQVIRGAGLWILCVMFSGFFASFYHEPQLRALLIVIGFSLVFAGFTSTSVSSLSRRMAIREIALLDLATQISQLVFTISWALIDRSAWALVGGKLVADGLRMAGSHLIRPRRRVAFRWDAGAARELFGFGRWVFCSTALTFLASQSDRFVLGKLVSLRTLGLYGVAFALSDVPRQVIQSFSGHVVFPFVSKLVNLPRAEYSALVLKYRGNVLFGAAALLAVVAASGDLFMSLIFDSRYRDATWIVPILAVGLWHTLLYNTASPSLFALGKMKFIVSGNLVTSLVILFVTPLSFHKWGMLGAVWTVALSDLPMYFLVLCGLKREALSPVTQDLKYTLFFLFFVSMLLVVRLAVGFPVPHSVALH
jgi:O-antigen/teichoic acid export membrane protein